MSKRKEKICNSVEKCLKILEEHRIIFILGINLIVILCAYLTNTPYNETNDDTGMAAIASGAYGTDSEYLVFQNIILGKFFHLFYTINGNWNWYSIFQFLITLSSFCLLGHVLSEKIRGKRFFFVYILLLKLFYQEFYLIYQFTRVSMLCCLTGYLLLFFSFTNNRPRWERIIGGIFVILGLLVRSASFKETTAFAFVIGVTAILLNKKFYPIKEKKKLWVEGTFTFVIMAVLILGVIQYDKFYVAENEEWKQYREYNRMRAVIQDYGWPNSWLNYETYQKEYEKLGISRNDCLMYEKANMSDTDVLDMDTITKLYRLKKEKMKENRPRIADYIRFTLSDTVVSQIFFINLMILLLYLIFYKRSCYDYLMIGNILMYIFSCGYMYYYNRIVDRVMIPTGFVLIVISLFCMDWENRKEVCGYRDARKVTALLAVAFLLIPGVSNHYEELKNARRDAKGLYEELENKENFFVAGHDVFRWNYYFFSAYQNIPKNFYMNQLNMGGWLARTPIQEKIKEKNRIENIFEALLEREHSYYYTDHSEEMVADYLMEHYAKGNVSYAICKVTPVCKFVKFSENFDTKDLKTVGSASVLDVKPNEGAKGYVDVSVKIQIGEKNEPLLGEESQIYLELRDKEQKECTTYYFRDNLEKYLLKKEDKVRFEIPYSEHYSSLERLKERYKIKGILQQGNKQYIFSVD
ncbi:MAG: hypothetical protein HFI37_00115 [Lachnospiraceae bacterium]|nr:hypothetical protein [Lachnospiraceae bacterium]